MSRVSIIVLLGPGERELQRFAGLMESLRYFEGNVLASSSLIVVNDSGTEMTLPGGNFGFRSVEVVDNPYAASGSNVLVYDRMMAGMIVALRRVFDKPHCDFVLKVDTDAISCGAFVERVISFFKANSKIGMIGSFRYHPDGELRSTESWWGNSIQKTCGLFPSQLVRFHLWHKIPFHYCRTLRRWFTRYRLMKQAVKRGWRLGDNILGGAYALSPLVIESFRCDAELFSDSRLFEGTRISEDVGVSMMVGAAGFGLGDFNRKGEVFGVWYQRPSFPMSTLVRNGYGLIHSIKAESPVEEQKMREQIRIASGMQTPKHVGGQS